KNVFFWPDRLTSRRARTPASLLRESGREGSPQKARAKVTTTPRSTAPPTDPITHQSRRRSRSVRLDSFPPRSFRPDGFLNPRGSVSVCAFTSWVSGASLSQQRLSSSVAAVVAPTCGGVNQFSSGSGPEFASGETKGDST